MKPKTGELKILFTDIIRGVTKLRHPRFNLVYIKHLNTLDVADVESISELYQEKAADLPTEEEALQYIIKESFWSEAKEREVKELKSFLSNLNVTKTKLSFAAEIAAVNKEIEDTRIKLFCLEMEKAAALPPVRESFIQKKTNEYYMFQAVYQDQGLIHRLFTEEEFNELENEDIDSLINLYNQFTEKFSPTTIKKIAVSPFFLNLFTLCNDDAHKFYGRDIISLTNYQVELFNNGRYFKHILSEYKDRITDEMLDDPDALVEWFNSNKNIDEKLAKSDKESLGGSTALVGASKKDLSRLGLEDGSVNLAKEAQKHGGKLTMQQLIEIQNRK